MKNKLLKISTIIILLITLTMSNFIFVGFNIYTYAIDKTATSHSNIEFDAYFKDSEGNKVEKITKGINDTETLYMEISVKKEGYFKPIIKLEDSNFEIKKAESPYIENIKENTITLKQINAGEVNLIQIEVKPIKNELYNIGLLDVSSKINLSGIYRDSTQKDINIQAQRELKFEIDNTNTEENISNDMEIVTNKIMQIRGEQKRVIQIKIAQGLKQNNYPIKNIKTKIQVPNINNEEPEVTQVINLNTMKSYDFKYQNSILEINFKNEPSQENTILWREQGTEEVLLTCIYSKDVNIENAKVQSEEEISLYNQASTKVINELTLVNEEMDNIIEVSTQNKEQEIYKGKLYSSIERQFETKTVARVNLARAVETITIKENTPVYTLQDTQVLANIEYVKTTISKDQINRVLGQEGMIVITNENGEIVEKINSSTQANEQGYVEINYNEIKASAIEIKVIAPEKEGLIELNHTKTIKQTDKEILKSAQNIQTNINYEYQQMESKEVASKIDLKESTSQARLEINKTELSTMRANTVEIKAILQSNNENQDLYKNPQIQIHFPQQARVDVNKNIKLMYEDEMQIGETSLNENVLTINLVGEQTRYKEATLNGAYIIIEATLETDKKLPTTDANIVMTYSNEKVNQYEQNEQKTTIPLKFIAPTDLTTINTIKELDVEEIGANNQKQVTLNIKENITKINPQIEIINNKQNEIKDVRILGTLPTKGKENNIDISVEALSNIENANIYYTENEDATNDLGDVSNAWTNEIVDNSKVKKYLIVLDKLDPAQSIKTSYIATINEKLEYNKKAQQGYEVTYIDGITQTENKVKSTNILMTTGQGPVAEVELKANIEGKEVSNNDTVRSGEVIKYEMQVKNTGTEDLNNIIVTAPVPEGTKQVVPEENYEYTGASYYKELDVTQIEGEIETLKVGETSTLTYEVRVINDIQEGKQLSNIATIKYGEVTKTSNQIDLRAERGTIRLSIKKLTDRTEELYAGDVVQYAAIVENISNETQKNIGIQLNVPEQYKVIFTQIDAQKQENTNTINSLEAGEKTIIRYDIEIDKNLNDVLVSNVSMNAYLGNDTYRSNVYKDIINYYKLNINMTTNANQYVKAGDIVDYEIKVKNENKTKTVDALIESKIPAQLTVTGIYVDGQEQPLNENNVTVNKELQPEQESTIKVETVVNYSETRENAETITSVATVSVNGKISTSNEVTHIIEPNEKQQGTDQNPSDNQTSGSGAQANGTKMISGIAFNDENSNGQKDEGETPIANVKVKLIDIQTGTYVQKDGKDLEALTGTNGTYLLQNLVNGQYIVVFEYNTSVYKTTTYKKQGVSENVNSDAIQKELTIQGQAQMLTVTDIITIDNENISNIDIGLVQLQNFDLKLDKYVSKIIIQSGNSTTTREYNNETLAKIELNGKTIQGTTAIIEYKIVVTNQGEVPGYAKKIVDELPNDLQFSSELNKQWYQQNGDLYTTALSNEIINPGESKTLTLTVTKAMTQNNTGLTDNIAEIDEYYNEAGISEAKNAPGKADVILSVKTGEDVIYIFFTIGVMLALIMVVIVILPKIKKQKVQNHKLGKI